MTTTRTLVGDTCYHPAVDTARGRTFIWVWLLTDRGPVQTLLPPDWSEAPDRGIRPHSKVCAVGRFRVRRRRMREEDQPTFLVCTEFRVMAESAPAEVPQPWPLHRGQESG